MLSHIRVTGRVFAIREDSHEAVHKSVGVQASSSCD